MKLIDADALEEKLDKIPARRIENADGRAYVLIRLSTVFEIIKQMPPAQPEAPCYLGSPCEYQNPNAEIQKERTEKRTETRACELISKQAAIDAIHNLYAIHGSEGSWIDQKDAFNAVNNLPSAQPERKTGSWIPYDTIPRYVVYRCSACGTDILVPCINDKTIFNYCPNCGVKMEVAQDE